MSDENSGCCINQASTELKLYQVFIFSVPILFTSVLLLLFYLCYLRRRSVEWYSLGMRTSVQGINLVGYLCLIGFSFSDWVTVIVIGANLAGCFGLFRLNLDWRSWGKCCQLLCTRRAFVSKTHSEFRSLTAFSFSKFQHLRIPQYPCMLLSKCAWYVNCNSTTTLRNFESGDCP